MEFEKVYTYIDEKTREKFTDYAISLGFKTNAPLLGVLIVREIRHRTLEATRTARSNARQDKKVVATLSTAHVTLFFNIADSLGRSRSDCAAELVIRELNERWLERVVAVS